MEVMELERTLTELDHIRLVNLIRRDKSGDRAPSPRLAIEHVLDTCALVPARQTPPDVVTMNSRVLLRDLDSGARSELTLSYPADADPASGSVSVLSPAGASLLGLRVGDVARWSTPAGEARAAEIAAVVFQPEASGDQAA